MTLCECGCGEPTTRSKVAPYGFNRFVYTHNNRLQGRKPEYEADHDTGCWNWVRHIADTGYGQTHKGLCAHRVVYERSCGPIPTGLTLDHLCRNRRCVNPDHLEPVPRGLNSRRGNAKLTEADVEEIRGRYPTDGGYKTLGLRYGVHWTTIRSVVTGRTWPETFKLDQRKAA